MWANTRSATRSGSPERAKGSDERGYRGEFIRLAETVRDLGWLKKS